MRRVAVNPTPPDDQVLSSSFLSSPTLSLIEDTRPKLLLRPQGTDRSPFSPLVTEDWERSFLPIEVQSTWKSIHAEFSDMRNCRPGVEAVSYFRLVDRLEMFKNAKDHFLHEAVSPAFFQLLLITIRDTLNIFRVSVLSPSDHLSDSDSLTRTSHSIDLLFSLFHHCAFLDQTRFLLHSDFLNLLFGFYTMLVDGLKRIPRENEAVDYLKVFYYVTQAVCSISTLLEIHTFEGKFITESHSKSLFLLKNAILTINSEANLVNLSETQFVFLASGSSFCVSLQPTQNLDLALILLIDLYNLSKNSQLFPGICSNLLSIQLKSLHDSFLRNKQFEGEISHLFCLFDKYLVVLHYFQSLGKISKSELLVTIEENKEMLRRVMMSCCWYFVKWECPLYRESFRKDDGRLGKLYELLLSLFEFCIGTPYEKLPLEFFSELPEYIESDYTTVCEDQPGVLQTYTLELINEYLQKTHQSFRLVAESSLLSLLLTPFFQLVPNVLQNRPFDIAELPTTENLAQLCSSYLSQTLQLVLKCKEGKVMFLQEFIKGFQQYKTNLVYISKLGRLMSEMVSNHDIEWVTLLAEMHLVDYIFQVVIDSKTSPDSLKPLQVTITTMLRIPQLAANLMQQKIIIKRVMQMMNQEEWAEFGMEVIARLLASNVSVKFYRRFARMLYREKDEKVLRCFYQSMELSLLSPEPSRHITQQLFIESQTFDVALKRFDDFTSISLLNLAIAAIRRLIHHSDVTHINSIPFKSIKNTVLTVVKSNMKEGELRGNIVDNLMCMMYDSEDEVGFEDIKIPQIGEIVLEIEEICGNETNLTRLLDVFVKNIDKNALIMSVYGMFPIILRILATSKTSESTQKSLHLACKMAKEHCHPVDLLHLFSLLNSDSIDTYPSPITSHLLQILKTAIQLDPVFSGSFFVFNRGNRIEYRCLLPKKHGFSVVIWLKLVPTGENTLFTFTNRDYTKVLTVSIAVNSSISIVYTVKDNVVYQSQSGLFPYYNLNMLSVIYNPARNSFKKSPSEISVFVNNEMQEIVGNEGKLRLEEDGFDTVCVGAVGSSEGLEGVSGCFSVFATALSEVHVEECYRLGPFFIGNYAEFVYDYRVSKRAFRLNRIKDVLPDLIIYLHPAFKFDSSHSPNLAQRLPPLHPSDYPFLNLSPPFRASLFSPNTANIRVINTIRLEHALNALGGVHVLLPLLKRLDKQSHRKSIFHPILEIIAKIIGKPTEIDLKPVILTLKLLLEKLSKRIIFKTSTALLVIDLKEKLSWSKKLQIEVIKGLILNPNIWNEVKIRIKIMLVSVINSDLFTSQSEKLQLVTLIIDFSRCVSNFSRSPIGKNVENKKEFLRKTAELIKMYTIEGDESDFQPYVSELMRNIVKYEGNQTYIVHLILKIVSFLAKRGKIGTYSEEFTSVMLYLIAKDGDGSRNYTKRALQILKMTVFESFEATIKKPDGFLLHPDEIVTFLNIHLKRVISLSEYQTLLSLMLSVPELRPKQTCWPAKYPELPYKDCYKDLTSEYKKVLIRFPRVIEVVTIRLMGNATREMMEDLALFAEVDVKWICERENWPGWAVEVWRNMELLDSDETRSRFLHLTSKIFSYSLLSIENSVSSLRLIFTFLSTERKNRPMELLSFLMKILDFLLENSTIVAYSELFKANLPSFSYLFEDIVTTLLTFDIEINPKLAISYIQIVKTAKMMHHSSPNIPEMTLTELLNRYKPENSRRNSAFCRDGGIARVAIKTTFQLFRNSSYTNFPNFAGILTDLIESLLYSTDKNTAKIKPKRPLDDLFHEGIFLFPLLFSELTDILITRKREKMIIKAVENVLDLIGNTGEMVANLESFVSNLSSEKILNCRKLMEVFVLSLNGKKGGSVEWKGLWECEDLEYVRGNIQEMVVSGLIPAYHSHHVTDILLSETWVTSIHPFFVVNTAGLLGYIDMKPIDFAPISSFPASPPTTDQLLTSLHHTISHLEQSTLTTEKDHLNDFLYTKTLWRKSYKWQTREAGIWTRSTSNEFVWKLDPEFDLEYKSMKLKKMVSRTKSYYSDKAHKKTVIMTPNTSVSHLFAREHGGNASPTRRVCQTITCTTEEIQDFEEVLVARSPSTPSVGLRKESVPEGNEGGVGERSQEMTFECERIQAKGASFGSISISPLYLIFQSARRHKSPDPKYFSSALVLFITEMDGNHPQKAARVAVSGYFGSVRKKVQSGLLCCRGLYETGKMLLF